MQPVTEFNQRIDQLVMAVTNGNNSEFARIIGTNETSVRNYRANRSNPPLPVAVEMIRNTNVNPNWLFFGEGEMFSNGDTHATVYQTASNGGTNINGNKNNAASLDAMRELLEQTREHLQREIARNEILEKTIAQASENYMKLHSDFMNYINDHK